MNKKYKLAVVIGRFQPFHNSHKKLIEFAYTQADKVLVMVGSENFARSVKNPLPAKYVATMITDVMSGMNLAIDTHKDYPNDSDWLSEVQQKIDAFDYKPSEVCIVGFNKDTSSKYLFDFRYKLVEAPQFGKLDSTKIRDLWFSGRHYENMVPAGIPGYLKAYENTAEFKNLKEDFNHINEYKALFKYHKFPPVFVTTDAVVYCKGHTLMIKRGGSPGKGQWALPGGFIEQNETVEEGIFRELMEETKIDVPPGKLKNSLRNVKVFDEPSRSLRGRTITHAGLIVLDEKMLPKVRGCDDAKEAMWVSNATLESMENQIFEDHFTIIKTLIRDA